MKGEARVVMGGVGRSRGQDGGQKGCEIEGRGGNPHRMAEDEAIADTDATDANKRPRYWRERRRGWPVEPK